MRASGYRALRPLGVMLGLGLVLGGSLGLFSACAHSPSRLPLSIPETVIVFVPGYKGSRLQLGSGKVVWITARESLHGSQSLALPMPGMGLPQAPALVPGDVLDRITIFPGLYALDIYGSLMERLGRLASERIRFVPFAYDWREPLELTAYRLAAKIKELRNGGSRHVWLVAHSQGGLIASYYLRYGDQPPATAIENWAGARDVDRVVLAGVPFHGTMIALRNLTKGERVFGNERLLEASASQTFPSAYELLPWGDQDELLGPPPQWKPLHGAIHAAVQWPKHHWGLCGHAPADTALEQRARDAFVLHQVKAGDELLSRVNAPLMRRPEHPIPLLYLFSRRHPTLARAVWLGDDSGDPNLGGRSLLFDTDDLKARFASAAYGRLLADGDGVVTAGSAILPPAFREALVATESERPEAHRELVTDERNQERIAAFLSQAPPTR